MPVMANQTRYIYHLTSAGYYLSRPQNQPYEPESLASEGFIHCTGAPALLVEVANTFFADLDGELWVLEIDPARLTAPLKFEPPSPPPASANDPGFAPHLRFPHIYGPLNRQAIVRRFALVRSGEGKWQLPE